MGARRSERGEHSEASVGLGHGEQTGPHVEEGADGLFDLRHDLGDVEPLRHDARDTGELFRLPTPLERLGIQPCVLGGERFRPSPSLLRLREQAGIPQCDRGLTGQRFDEFPVLHGGRGSR